MTLATIIPTMSKRMKAQEDAFIRARTRPTEPWQLKEREPTGRFKREGVEDVLKTGLDNRIRTGVDAKDARSQLAGTMFGRLRLDGRISSEQYLAGERWSEVVRRFARLIGVPSPHPKSPSVAFVGGGKDHGDEPLTEQTIYAIRRDYEDAYSALIDNIEGREMLKAMKEIIIMDRAGDIGAMRSGLNVLLHLWR